MQKGTDSIVVRTPRGLSIAGTRITLYQIMDYLKSDLPTEIIRLHFRLTVQQMAGVTEYIQSNRKVVETEYQRVVEQSKKNREYWEEKNKQRFDEISKLPRKPEHLALWAKLDAKKEQLGIA